MSEATDNFPVQGRISVRGDGAPQNAYNLMLLDEQSMEAMDALGTAMGFDAKNDQGDTWTSVTIDAAGKAKLRQVAAKGSTKIIVEGHYTAVDLVNGKPQGVLRITGARAATLLDGGRVITRERREAPVAAAVPTLGLRGRAQA